MKCNIWHYDSDVYRNRPMKFWLSFQGNLISSLETTAMATLWQLCCLTTLVSPRFASYILSNCTVQMCPSGDLSVIGPQTYLLNGCCSALSHMHWRRQSIRTRTFTGRASRRSTTFHVSLLLTSLPWITQTSSSPAHTKKLLGGTMPFILVCIFAVESLTFLTLKNLWAADIPEPSYVMVGHFLFSWFAVRRL